MNTLRYLIGRTKCFFGRHLWIEWEQGGDRRRNEFVGGTKLLEKPECVWCGVRGIRRISLSQEDNR